jgi:hypothetical protein
VSDHDSFDPIRIILLFYTNHLSSLTYDLRLKQSYSQAGMKLLIFYKRTLPLSVHWVSIIMILALCSQIILQKSFIVDVSGPCVAMYSLPEEHPLK